MKTAEQIRTTATKAEAEQLMQLAIGRLLKIGSRPAQSGDMDTYDEIRSIVMAANEVMSR